MSAEKQESRDEPVEEIAGAPAIDERAGDGHAAEEQASAAARADEILDRAGERVGQLIRSGERAGQFLRSGGEQLKQLRAREKQEAAAAAEDFLPEETPEAVARAGVIMDRAGERVGQLLHFGGRQVYRSTARAREAVGGFVAEAESIRRGERPNAD